MKFIHIADIHASRERLSQTLSILKTLTERAKLGDIDFIIFTGDFWDSTITATKGSGFADIVAAIRKLENFTHLYFLYGTPSHEPNGSLDAFKSSKTDVINSMSYTNNEKCYIVFIPEPRRSEYITDSVQKITDLINLTIENWIKETVVLHEKSKEYLPVLDTYEYNKPLIVAYHGEVKGAVYQNGASASSPTAISKELLQSLNANYYAFGHIHLPQEVFENAWYAGSACPKDFGEQHDGHYNLVTIENDKTKLEQVSFNLPRFVTIYDRPEHYLDNDYPQNKNANIRFIFNCTKEERKQINIKAYAEEIKNRLNCLSVKLELNVTEGEYIQTSEVSRRKSIVEKMVIYAAEKSLKIPKYAKELLQEIQDGTLAKLSYPQHSFELLYLSLRGAIGIRDGQGKEEIELNFEKYEDGIICLCGKMGAGKSTILENCHPYPKMLSRKGTLQEHFCLKDSHRILIYKDENGLFYRISMLIDGKTANGKVLYFVETSKDRNVWKSISDINGSSDSYKEWVNNTFGSIDIYLRTAFFAKEPTKDATDISDTTKGERMELLSKLAGTDQLKEVSEIARNLRVGSKQKKIVGLEEISEKLETEIKSYSHYEEEFNQNIQDIDNWKEELKEQNKNISTLENKIAELKVADTEYKRQEAILESSKALCQQYQKELDLKYEESKDIDYALSHYLDIEKIAECKNIVLENNKKIPQFQKNIKSKKEEIASLESEITGKQKEKDKARREYSKLETKIQLLKQQIVPVSDICPTCGAKLSDEKHEHLMSAVKENELKLEQLISEQRKYEVPEDEDDWVLIPLITKRNKLKEDVFTLDVALMDMIDKVSECNSHVEAWGEYEKYSSMKKNDLEKLSAQIKKTINELIEKLEKADYKSELKDVSVDLKNAENEMKDAVNRKAELSASIKSAEKENERYRKELESVESKQKELDVIKDKITAYSFIEEAFSNKGIPAIELRESAPEIADITNQILRSSYGNKFEIHFGSSSEIKTKKKADEDFNIIVTDTVNNDEKTIDLVSSGERIWIKQALFYAFSIIQMNRTGFNFRTRFIDESDGSIDGTLRPKYLKMVESAHEISNSRTTVLITHSQEIKDIAQQIIEV